MRNVMMSLLVALFTVGTVACASKAGNVAIGAGAAGAAYEYSNKEQIESLDRDLQQGKISKEEYDRRRAEIEKRSAVY